MLYKYCFPLQDLDTTFGRIEYDCFLNGPNPASFCLFSFFSHDKYSTTLTIDNKSIDGVLGTRTWGSRMIGTDKSTELWWHPKEHDCFCFINGTATQLVIVPSHIPWKGQGGGILLLLCYSMNCVIGLTIFDLNGRSENRSRSIIVMSRVQWLGLLTHFQPFWQGKLIPKKLSNQTAYS